jgi:predicted nucleotidyltransferase
MNIELPRERVEEFCRKWEITEFALFGSVLTDEFRPDSDVDVLVTFGPGRRPRLREWLAMEDELQGWFGRRVDLVEKSAIENPFVRHHVLHNHRVLYGGPER